MVVIALLYLMAYYVSGLHFGIYKNPYRLTFSNFFKFFLPVAAIVVLTEVIRYVSLAQEDKLASVLCWVSCVLAEMLILSNIPSITSFNKFMDLVAGALFPALLYNSLYHYLSRRYGLYPNLAFRLMITLHSYTFPISSGISDSLLNFVRLLVPISIFLFIDSLYEKKRRYALQKVSRLSRALSIVLTVAVLVIMFGTVMLISNQFRFGALVIATDSMTGELNKGDVAIFERYDDQFIAEGQVIVFEQSKSMIVHRVVDIQIINGITRYYTKGDANEDQDSGFLTDADIVGLVDYKLPFFGYPTLWMRSLFRR
jgi:signal peptidase